MANNVLNALVKLTGLDNILRKELAKNVQAGAINPQTMQSDDVMGDLTLIEESLSQFNLITRMHRDRSMRYQDYDAMDNYGDVSVALDIYSEEATQTDLIQEDNIWITSQDTKISGLLEQMFKKIKMRTIIQGMAREIFKYGDLFISPKYDNGGIKSILYLPARYVQRVGPDLNSVKHYKLDNHLAKVAPRKDGILLPWECVHFRMVSFGFSTLYGKCVAEGSHVWTEGGIIPIQDVKPGDRVQILNTDTNEYEVADVKNTACNGVKDLLEIHTAHRVVTVTKEHPMPYVDYKGKVHWKQAKDLKVTNRLAVAPSNLVHRGESVPIVWPTKFTSFKSLVAGEVYVKVTEKGILSAKEGFVTKWNKITNITDDSCDLGRRQALSVLRGEYATTKGNVEKLFACLNRPLTEEDFAVSRSDRFGIQRFPHVVTSGFARWFGFMLGDGWTNDHELRFAEGEDAEVNNRYTKLTEEMFICSVKKRVASSTRKSEYTNFYVGSTELVDMLKAMGWVTGAHNKTIPSWVFKLPREQQEEFVLGLMDADGWTTKQHAYPLYHIELCNKGLVEDLRVLVESLGYSVGKVRKRGKRTQTICGVECTSNSPTWLLTFNRTKVTKESERIQKIVPVDATKVYDLEIDSPHHNFVVDGMPVHNSGIEPARKRWLQLKLLEDAIAIYRLNRAVERIVFYIDVGQASPQEALRIVQQYKRKFGNKRQFIDPNAPSEFHQAYDPHNLLENYYWPVNSATERSKIEKLQAPQEQGQLYDLDHFNEKLYVSLGIPRDYLTGEISGSWNSKESLVLQDVRFSRKIHRVQESLLEGVEYLCRFHIAIVTGDAELARTAQFKIHLADISKIARQQYDQILLNRVQLLVSLHDMGTQMQLRRDIWVPYILKNYFPDLPEELLSQVIISDKELAQAHDQLTKAQAGQNEDVGKRVLRDILEKSRGSNRRILEGEEISDLTEDLAPWEMSTTLSEPVRVPVNWLKNIVEEFAPKAKAGKESAKLLYEDK